MSVFVETTALQDNLVKREQTLLQTLQISHAVASQMQMAKTSLWSLPDEELLAVLNADVTTALDTQALLDDLAFAINSLLDAAVEDRPELAGNLPYRAPLGYGRDDVEFDPSIPAFKIVSIEEPEGSAEENGSAE
jgi:hypothetical protein